ncbi:NAD(P)/FAD-dependent oxidoreductase [Ferroplasma acidiphilum]|jgi:thioredoxin reductase (NADPH)|uniref:Ferredoxin--NADP reductase n=1 Tax=Ferroplasma acidiphilum TaxID=74969 RepID=A0A7K4FL14_9ARCH|nr:NAD(P)/FAD-dependent oxidoreductase [Ferroplasma acidiphilum]MCL4349317.1 NAD(P)/FAD-dependent oxidoreductase [Candidatus Thermoplasmatota archaeon]NOL59696.1 NAD(P)/FAD-dependent oxidoreductase [Ferroplasma acidiphilum]
MDEYDLVIIGAGPTGLFATFLAGLRDIKSVTLEALDYTGGQIPELYPEKMVYDVQGIPKINATELRDKMYEQAKLFDGEIKLSSKVTDIIPDNDEYIIEVNGVKEYKCKAVLIATGIGDFTPRKIGCRGEDEFKGKGVDYTVKDITKFKDMVVAIVGGGDSALDYADELSGTAKKVYVLHHSEKFKAAEKTLDAVMNNKGISLMMNTSVTEIKGDSKIREISTINEKDKTTGSIKVDALVIAIGHVGKANVFKSVNIETSKNGRTILVNNEFQTNLKGIYAVGDGATAAGEPVHPIIAIDGANAYIAINFIKKYLTPNATMFGGHSSSLNIK